MTIYTVNYELGVNSERVPGEMQVEAVSEERALEYAIEVLDQEWDEQALILEIAVVAEK